MENKQIDILDAVEDSFKIYAGMTIKKRALIDVRDCLKPAARMCMYAQKLENIISSKPFVKSVVSVSEAMKKFYNHGDAACYDLLTQLARCYNMRYPLVEFKGQYGTISTGKQAASRYTDMRLGKLGEYIYNGIEKDCIDIWFDGHTPKDFHPSVTPSLGYYNICNGTQGIATGMASSIPQFNLREVNEAMIKLLNNPEIDFDEIYCPPDFAVATTILNADKVKEALKIGKGSVRMRASVTYDAKENSLTFTNAPYGVYIQTITEQIVNKMNEGIIVGIAKDGIKDFSTMSCNLKIYLEKGVNPTKMIKTLYKETSLDDIFIINMTMLDKGTFPKVFGWKDALQAHLDHEVEVRTKIHNFEIKKIDARLNIIEGILIALADVDNVISIIRNSETTSDAKAKLIEKYGFNELQVKAILDIKLAKLAHLEIESFKNEKQKLLDDKQQHLDILSNRLLLNKEIEDDLRAVANKYGDERRTKLMNFDFAGDKEDAEPIERKELIIHYTNLGNIYTQESTTLMKTKRGAKGTKLKLSDNEAIVRTISDTNFSSLMIFSNKGLMYHISTDELPINTKINLSQLFEFSPGERPTAITTLAKRVQYKYFIFVTKNGMIKKTESSEYIQKRGKSLKAINLKDEDEVVNVMFVNDEKVGILTNNGNYVTLDTTEINAIGRATAGVKAIKLSSDDYVIDSKKIKNNDKYFITLSKNGLIKKSNIEEFPVCSRAIKGKKISDIRENDKIINFLTLSEDCDIIISTKKKNIKISSSELRLLSRAATGVKSTDLVENDSAITLIKSQE